MIEKYRVRIVHDQDPINPREWANTTTITSYSKDYDIGDLKETPGATFERLANEVDPDYESDCWNIEDAGYSTARLYFIETLGMTFDDAHNEALALVEIYQKERLAQADKKIRENFLIYNLQVSYHSCAGPVALRLCTFDPEDLDDGFVYMSKATIEHEWAGDWGMAEKCLRAEIEAYNQYLEGDIWGFIVEKEVERYSRTHDGEYIPHSTEWENVDSCWDFYGSDPKTNGMLEHINPKYHELALEAKLEY